LITHRRWAFCDFAEILLADEPTSDLDEQTEKEIVELFAKGHGKTGTTIVMVTHTSQLTAYGTRTVTMILGEIVRPLKGILTAGSQKKAISSSFHPINPPPSGGRGHSHPLGVELKSQVKDYREIENILQGCSKGWKLRLMVVLLV
jgi:energy-coupling factor transporter ATP-binding protein EcfA2